MTRIGFWLIVPNLMLDNVKLHIFGNLKRAMVIFEYSYLSEFSGNELIVS